MDLRTYPKILFYLLICYFIFTITACAAGRIIENKFVSEKKNYRVTTLDEKNWRIVTDYFDTDIAYLNNEYDGEIWILTIQSQTSISKLADVLINRLKYNNLIDEFSPHKKTKISGVEALEVEYKGLYQGKDIYIKNKEYIYILRYIITAIYYDKYLEDFQKVIDSFEFLK